MQRKMWQDDYFKKHPDAGSLQVLWAFTIDNPTLVLRKLYLNPIFIFTLAARHVEFYCNLVIVLITLLFVVVGMYYIPKDTKFWIIAGVISGYLLLFIIVHAYNRYSVAVLPILYVFAGKGFLETVKSMRARFA